MAIRPGSNVQGLMPMGAASRHTCAQRASKARTVTYVASLVDPAVVKAPARLPTMGAISVRPAALRRWTLSAVGAHCVVSDCAVAAPSLHTVKNHAKVTNALHVSERIFSTSSSGTRPRIFMLEQIITYQGEKYSTNIQRKFYSSSFVTWWIF